jgi:hypothetical protein
VLAVAEGCFILLHRASQYNDTRPLARQIEDLYHAAQKCGPTERAALLECTDPEIRFRVERRLNVESDSQIVDQPVGGSRAMPPTSRRAPMLTGTPRSHRHL